MEIILYSVLFFSGFIVGALVFRNNSAKGEFFVTEVKAAAKKAKSSKK
jgi:hypothetical protein